MGYVLAKDWPVGEPSGIKVINDDLSVKAPKPTNCIMATSYLADHYLDSSDPQQVTCSSPFQTHKRYKLAMLPASVDGENTESIDLVFNVDDDGSSRDYQVFQKINNWTNTRLQGFSVQVGFGVGTSFQTVEAAGVELDDLNISVPSIMFDEQSLANFSAGLFGPLDKHTGSIGFFDPEQRAGFFIDEYTSDTQPSLTDTLHATRTLGSDYVEVPAGAGNANQFGPWLPSSMLPEGVFFDDDGNPETDAELLAWYGYNPETDMLGWMSGSQGSEDDDDAFSAISNETILEMGENLSYTQGEIDDLVNVGLNYVVTIGDVSEFPGGTFTIRITPTVETIATPAPSYVDAVIEPLLLFRSSDAEIVLEPKEEFVVGSLLTARVGDADLNLDPLVEETVDVTIYTDNGSVALQILTLTEQGANRGVFAASLPDDFSNVVVGTEVFMSYFDENTGKEVDEDDEVDEVDEYENSSETKVSSTIAIAEILPILSDVSITDFSVPDSIVDGKTGILRLAIINDKKADGTATGTVFVNGSDGSEFTAEFIDLKVGGKMRFRFRWTAELEDPTEPDEVEWNVSIIINDQIVDDTSDNTEVEVKVRKNSRR